ncbi:MAG TPA: cytochrome c peroxidase [Burkholderiaceae bacterium]|nr:cytochrome c peroxidase [Burkholderiaceae bacterium]
MLALTLAGCGGGTTNTEPPAATERSDQAALGELIFKDASLSASGRQACATCHVESNAHSPDNALPAQMGGRLLDQQGGRSAPSARYLAFNTAFFFDAEGTPTGGFFWDGRATSLQAQAHEPFLNPVEMANGDAADVVAKLARTPYAEEFKRVYGADILMRAADAFDRMALALQRYQLEDVEFRRFTSKFDEFLRGKVQLTAQEQRGLALFNAPAKGNCAACHPSAKAADGSHPLFTDFTYDNLGVPRNVELAQNADPAYFDLGLCARAGGDLAARGDLCGAFKVPSLRNVALRQAYFHNGYFKTLKSALTFYVQRDTHPEKWYPLKSDGSVDKFDDLPDAYKANVNTTEAPYNRQLGDVPALSDAEIDDVIAFLRTLSDGYAP